MNDIEIQKGKIKYNNLVKKRDKYKFERDILFRKAKRDYLLKMWLKNSCPIAYSHYANYGNVRLANMAFSKIAKNTKDSKEIYVFIGFLDKKFKYARNNKKIKSAVFADLETMKIINVDYEDYDKFITDNKVIYSTEEHKFNDMKFYLDYFIRIRKKYLTTLVFNSQEEAIQKILKK